MQLLVGRSVVRRRLAKCGAAAQRGIHDGPTEDSLEETLVEPARFDGGGKMRRRSHDGQASE